MKKKILLIPLLFSAFVVAGCSTSGGGGGGGSDPETPTKHTDAINLDNYKYYFEVIAIYSDSYSRGFEFHGAIPNGIYTCRMKIENDQVSKTFDVAANGYAYATLSSGVGYGIAKVTECSGSVSYWF